MVLHIALPGDLADARRTGFYAMSTRGVTIAEQGFMHASKDMDQATRVHDYVYSDLAELVLLHIDEQRVAEAGLEVRMEPGDPSDPASEQFPHIYGGELPLDAVVEITRWDESSTQL